MAQGVHVIRLLLGVWCNISCCKHCIVEMPCSVMIMPFINKIPQMCVCVCLLTAGPTGDFKGWQQRVHDCGVRITDARHLWKHFNLHTFSNSKTRTFWNKTNSFYTRCTADVEYVQPQYIHCIFFNSFARVRKCKCATCVCIYVYILENRSSQPINLVDIMRCRCQSMSTSAYVHECVQMYVYMCSFVYAEEMPVISLCCGAPEHDYDNTRFCMFYIAFVGSAMPKVCSAF